MSETPKIYRAMAAILKDFGFVAKSATNPHFKYNYRGVDDALGAIHPLMAKHGVFLTLVNMQAQFMEAGNQNVRCVVHATARFVADDGTFVDASLVGEGMDKGDKALMKAQANGLKYVVWYTFCVPTSEVKDSEAFPEPTEDDKPKFKVEKPANGNKPGKAARADKPSTPVATRQSKTELVDVTPYLDGISAATSPEELDGVVALIKEKSAQLDPVVRKQIVDKIKEKRVQLA
jgi:hypothetical protein